MQLKMLFFFNDTATTEIYTLSLHDALPICPQDGVVEPHVFHHAVLVLEGDPVADPQGLGDGEHHARDDVRSEEHTSELQSRQYLVCRLLLEKKKYHTKTLRKARNSTRLNSS